MTDSKVPNPFSKPRVDFPLYPHRTGRWAKRVRGQIKYFGKCADDSKGEAALLQWLDQKDDLLAGRTPRAGRERLTIADRCEQFLQAKDRALESSEITQRTRRDSEETTDRIVAQFGSTDWCLISPVKILRPFGPRLRKLAAQSPLATRFSGSAPYSSLHTTTISSSSQSVTVQSAGEGGPECDDSLCDAAGRK